MNPIDKLREITQKRVWLTSRGNQSILQALMIARSMGAEEVLIPDQGGWLTYKTIPGLLGMKTRMIKTDDAQIDPSTIKCSSKDVLLLASLAGYFIPLDMDKITEIAHKNGSLVIDDISGSIGRAVSTKPDITICSFGRWKPLNLENGGMVALSDNICNEIDIDVYKSLDRFNGDTNELSRLIEGVEAKQERYRVIASGIKKDLNKKYDIVHGDEDGINIIIRCQGDEKKEIILYCQDNGYEYTECPRYIRMNSEGISIEVKRTR